MLGVVFRRDGRVRWTRRRIRRFELDAVRDLGTDPPFAAWPVALPIKPDAVVLLAVDDDASQLVFGATTDERTDLFAYQIGHDGPSPAWHVDGELDPVLTSGSVAFVQGHQRVVFATRGDADGNGAVWLGPANGDAPGLAMLAEVAGDVFGPRTAPNGSSLVYGSGGSAYSASHTFWVDLGTRTPSAPLALGMLAGAVINMHAAFAPDGASVAFTQGVPSQTFDIAWIALTDGVPQPPVRVSTGDSEGLAIEPAWSPDGRWLTFHTDPADARFVVPFDGGVPGLAIGHHATGDAWELARILS